MSNWMIDQDSLNHLNVSGHDVPEHLFKYIKDTVENAKKEGIGFQHRLAGHLKEEYEIKDRNEEFEEYLAGCSTSGNVYQSWKDMVVLNENAPIILQNLWVNYQKKYDFNPPHTHSGFVSFVIFVQIPYDLKQEEKVFENANNKQTSKFTFHSPDHRFPGGIDLVSLNIDKSYEGKMIMFKASQIHSVYPFYTSDDYRITVSGNLVFKVTS